MRDFIFKINIAGKNIMHLIFLNNNDKEIKNLKKKNKPKFYSQTINQIFLL